MNSGALLGGCSGIFSFQMAHPPRSATMEAEGFEASDCEAEQEMGSCSLQVGPPQHIKEHGVGVRV